MANEEHLRIIQQGVVVWNEWRSRNNFTFDGIPDLKESNLEGLNLEGANLWGADFKNANLTGTNLAKTNLESADFKGTKLQDANLSDTDLSKTRGLKKANLSGVNLSRANLSRVDLFDANVSNAILEDADLWHTTLTKANLQGANLSGADLRGANLNIANFTSANLSNAILTRTQALATDFNRAIFTGACLEDWHTNNLTNLDEVACDYVYLKFDPYPNHSERCPHSGIFGLGEFTKLFKKSQEIVELIFRDNISWDAFACAYKRLQIENEDLYLDIKTIDKRDSVLVVTVVGIPEAYQIKWREDFWQRYKLALQALKARYQAELKNKDGQIVLYERLISQNERTITRQEETINQNLGMISQLIERLDNPVLRDINIQMSQNSSVTTNHNSQSFMSENYENKYNIPNSNIGSIVDTAQDNARVQSILHNYAPEQKQTPAEAAIEIQNLLKQLQSDGFSLDEAQKQVASDLVNRAQNNPTFKNTLESWARYFGDAAANAMIGELVVPVFKFVSQSLGFPLP